MCYPNVRNLLKISRNVVIVDQYTFYLLTFTETIIEFYESIVSSSLVWVDGAKISTLGQSELIQGIDTPKDTTMQNF